MTDNVIPIKQEKTAKEILQLAADECEKYKIKHVLILSLSEDRSTGMRHSNMLMSEKCFLKEMLACDIMEEMLGGD